MNSRNYRKVFFVLAFVLARAHGELHAQKLQFARVVSKRVERTAELPGEFYPFLTVQLHAKVSGYVEKVQVDRGSFVKQGELLVELTAPELMARISQAEAQSTAAESDEAQAQAQ
jgi:membrane fusion protein, multidrug efflux system